MLLLRIIVVLSFSWFSSGTVDIGVKELFTNKFLVKLKEDSLEVVKQTSDRFNMKYLGRVVSDFHEFEKTDMKGLRDTPVDDEDIEAFKSFFTDKVLSVEQDVLRYELEDDPKTLGITVYKAVFFSTGLTVCPPYYDMGVEDAWRLGYTGKGVTVGVVDIGIDLDNPDLKYNINKSLCYNFINNNTDASPPIQTARWYPEFEGLIEHGVKAASLIAAVKGNQLCSSGVAPNASIASLRVFGGQNTEEIRRLSEINVARAFQYHLDDIHIYSNSWGTTDKQSCTLRPMGTPTSEAMQEGIAKGRNGKGSIFVVPSGNGGPSDNCNKDGYANSIYTITISSVGPRGTKPEYAEPCASTLASTFGQGGKITDDFLVTSSIFSKCSKEFRGTSASVALASGIIALALQANPDLTYRDVQHLIVNTSDYNSLRDSPGWKQNGAGIHYHPYFGFGLLNASAMVHAAVGWNKVSDVRVLKSQTVRKNRFIGPRLHRSSDVIKFEVGGCKEVELIEQVVATITYKSKNAMELVLRSPSGTGSVLLSVDVDCPSFETRTWNFSSTNFWNEDPSGNWTIVMKYKKSNQESYIEDITLYIYGTTSGPLVDLNVIEANYCQRFEETTHNVKDGFQHSKENINILAIFISVLIAICFT